MNKSEKQIAQSTAQLAKRWASRGYEKGERQPQCTELLKIHHDKNRTVFVSNSILATLTETKFVSRLFTLYSTQTQQ